MVARGAVAADEGPASVGVAAAELGPRRLSREEAALNVLDVEVTCWAFKAHASL